MPRLLITDPIPEAPTEIPSGCLVVAPHPRVARTLSAPCISLQTIAKNVLKKKGFGIAPPIKANEALRRAVGMVLPGSDTSSLARHHREIIGAMLRSGVDTTLLAKIGSERARTAALIAQKYVELLERERLLDAEAALITAVKKDLVEPAQVLIYGYFRARQLPARAEEIEFIDALADDGSVFYLPCGNEPLFRSNRAWRDLLTSRGWTIRKSESRETSPPMVAEKLAARFADPELNARASVDDSDAFEYPDLVSEVQSTLARAKATVLAGVLVDQIAIVCRDMTTYALPIIATAREYDIPIRLECEIPIAETELGRFIALIFEVVERRTAEEIASGTGSLHRGFLYEPTLRLMLQRLGPGLTDEQRASAYKTLPSSYDSWRSITDDAELLFTAGERSAADWVAWLRNLLGRWKIRAKEKLGTSATEIMAYDRLFRSLDQVTHTASANPIHVSAFAAEVADVLANVTTPLSTLRGGILVTEPNNLAGCSFDTIFVVGMAEGSLPAVSTDSNVIDLFECERLREHGVHLQDALEIPRWEALSFYFTLLACRRRIVFSYPKFALDREQIASSYFKRLGLAVGSDTEKYVSGIVEYRRAFLTDPSRRNDETFSTVVRQFDVERRRESAEPADEYDGVIGIPVKRASWSASSLTKFGSCRFKWFASDILRLREPAEAETDLPPNTRGTLLHKTLELAVGRSRSAVDIRKAVLEILEAAFAEAEQLDDSLDHISNWQLRRAEQIEKLRIAISSKDFVAPGAAVLDVEKDFKVEFCGLTITGTIDRIDRLADKSISAVDYKHGQTIGKVQDESGNLTIDIQLPLYCLAAMPALYPDEQHAGGQFFHIADPKLTRAKDINLIDFLERVKHALATGNFAVEPDVRGDACKYCSYDVVCRVGPRLARKAV